MQSNLSKTLLQIRRISTQKSLIRHHATSLIACIAIFGCASISNASTPFTGTPFSEPGTVINASDFDNGTQGDAYSIANPAPPAQNEPAYRSTVVPMNVANAATYGGSGYVVGISNVGGDYIVPGDWIAYSTNFTTGGYYDLTLDVATSTSGRYMHVLIDGVNVTGTITLPDTPGGSWNQYETVTVPNVEVASGAHKVELVVDSPIGLFNINWFSFTHHVGQTYYVSPTGSDSNSGLSTSTPWLTCAKVESMTYSGGDTVLFQRGGSWRERLYFPGSGNPTQLLTFGDYGTGTKPIFYGSDILPNANFAKGANPNEYTISVVADVNSVLVNHAFLLAGNPDTTASTWSYASGVLKINVPSNPTTDGNLYTACTRPDEIFTNYQNHLVLRNLISDETAQQNGGYGVRVDDGTDILLSGLEAYNCGATNIGVIDSTQVTLSGCIAEYEMPGQGNSTSGLFFVYCPTDPSGNSAGSAELDNCVAGDAADTSTPGNYYQTFDCHGAELGSVVLNNFSAANGQLVILQDSGATNESVKFQGGTISDAVTTLYAANSLFDGTTFTGNAAIDVYGSNNVFQNLLMTILPANGGQTGYNSAFVMRNGAKDNTIRFSTVVMNSASAGNWPCLTLTTSGSATSWYSNIFLSTGAPVIPYYYTPTSSDVGNTDYNFYNATPTFGESGMTFAQWQTATGADKHSLSGDPMFVNPATGNYNLQSTSTAINAATIPSKFLTGLPPIPTDFNGNNRLSGAAYDMGAFEYQFTPSITSASTASGTVGTAFSYQIAATNNPTSYTASGLPAGLSLNSSTGLISGTPTAAGTSTVTLGATNASGTGHETLTITISSGTSQAPVIKGPKSKTGYVGTALTYKIVATNSPTSYAATGLPAGLTLNTKTGSITGTPTTGGTYSVKLSATNTAGTGSGTVTFHINAAPVITSGGTRAGTVGAAFDYKIIATNKPTSYGATPLPAGLTLNTTTGAITGTPTTKGTTSVTLSATNKVGTGTKILKIIISAS